MSSCVIQSVLSVDARFVLPAGAGIDSVHTNSLYCMALTRLATDRQVSGTGLALTLGDGNRIVCAAIDQLAKLLVGMEINDLMLNFGKISRRLAQRQIGRNKCRFLIAHITGVASSLPLLDTASMNNWIANHLPKRKQWNRVNHRF